MCHVYNATLNEYREMADVDYSSSRPNCGLFRITGIQDAAYSRSLCIYGAERMNCSCEYVNRWCALADLCIKRGNIFQKNVSVDSLTININTFIVKI